MCLLRSIMKGLILLFMLLVAGLSEGNQYDLRVGPWGNETGTFVYEGTYGIEHCRICDDLYLTDSKYERYQQQLCYKNTKNLSEDKDKLMYPICSRGDPPGCGGLPQVTPGNNQHWYCDPGYSFKNYSVYFSCAIICNITDRVIKSYYCNEKLVWEFVGMEQSEAECQVPAEVPVEAPEQDNKLVYIIVIVGLSVVAIVIVLAIIYVCRKGNCLRKIISRENLVDNGLSEMIPMNDRHVQDVRSNIDEEQVDIEQGLDERRPLNPPNNSLNSDRENGSRDNSIETEHNSINTSLLHTNKVKPTIKIMTSKNNTTQTSVPIQSGRYSIEKGSDFFIIPDSPGGIAITEFIIDCKTNGRSFRGEKNGFMYQVIKVGEDDDDIYRWKMKLENGSVHQGTFEIYVKQPPMASIHRNAPEGEENDSNVVPPNANNQQVRAEVYNDHQHSYLPFSNDIYSENHPGPNQNHDSGLSSRSSHSRPNNNNNNNNINRARFEDTRFSSSGYSTQPSGERHMEEISDILRYAGPLNPDTISNELSSRSNSRDLDLEYLSRVSERPSPLSENIGGPSPLSGNIDRPSPLSGIVDQPSPLRSIDRPSPQGYLAEGRNEDPVYDVYGRQNIRNDDDDDGQQTSIKRYWENEDPDVCRSEDIHPNGEIEHHHTNRPINLTSPSNNVHSPVYVEEFDKKIKSALKILAHNPIHSNDDDDCIPNDDELIINPHIEVETHSRSNSSIVDDDKNLNENCVDEEISSISKLSLLMSKDETLSDFNTGLDLVNTNADIDEESSDIQPLENDLNRNNLRENNREMDEIVEPSEILNKNDSSEVRGRKSPSGDSS